MTWQRIWRFLAAAVLAVAIVAAQPAPGLACSCGGGGEPLDIVFVGRVVAVVEGDWVRKRLRANRQRWWSTVALLSVESMQAGPRQPFFTVAGGYEADCGVHFEPGSTYFINGERPRRGFGPLETTICNGSEQLGEWTGLSVRPRRGRA